METKHTPGPWNMGSIQNNDGTGNYSHSIGPVVVRQHLLGKTATEIHANANLIAAAPELLSALRGMVAIAEDQGWTEDFTEIANAAIAKATGTK